MEELIPTLQEEGEERIDTLAEQTIIAGVQTINGKAGDLDLKTINNTDLLTPGNINLATPTDIHNLDTAKQDKLVAGTNIQIAADGKTISATDTTYSAGSGLNLTGTIFSVDTDTIATQNDIYTLQTTKQDNLTTTQLNAVNSGIDSTKVAQIATNEGDIATINGKIPTQASTSNQLADKNFVNSSVQTATANYRGSWDDWASVPTQASDYPEDYAGSHTPTVNDYMVVQDASDYTEETLEGTWRFKYTGEWNTNGKSGWLPEYQVNETPLTAAQIAAINSGITDTLVAQISTNQSNISDLSTNKLDKNTTFWGQSVQNGAVQGTLTLTESGQNATIATSGHNTADADIKMGNSKNYVEAGVTEITLSSTTGGIKLKPKSGSSVDVMSSKITNLATPTANTDASTKKYVDDGLAGKQNTLTAGTNIQISGDTISATDTTYTAGTGLTLTGTEFSVNDPAPSGFWTGSATDSGTGTSITINNVLATTPKDIKLDGDTEQISYTGKNLWGGVSSYSRSISDVDFTTNADGSITVQGTASNTAYSITGQLASQNNVYKTLAAGTYYLSSKDTLPTGFMLQAVSVPGSDTLRDGVGSFTLSAQTSIAIRVRISSGTAITTATTVFPQLELSATKTDYEPYVGGIPSPNPDYPQDVNVVTGRQTVGMVGKNWFDNTAAPFRSSQATLSALDTGIRVSVAATGTWRWGGIYIGNAVDFLGKTLTLSSVLAPSGTNSGRIIFGTCASDGTNRKLISGSELTSTGSVHITITSVDDNRPKLYLAFYANTGTSADTNTYCDYTNVQLELGSTATAYEPYQGGSYEINLGKNLLDLSVQPASVNAVTTSYDSATNSLSVASTGSGSGYIYARYDLKTLKPGNTYSIKIGSFTNASVTNERILYVASYNGSSSTQLLEVKAPNLSGTFTIPNDSKEIRVYFYTLLNTTSVFQEVQLEAGLTATTYAPYFTPIELCKIGDYQDYIYKANGNWYKHAEIGKVVLDGTEDWSNWAAGSKINTLAFRVLNYPTDIIDTTSTAVPSYRLKSSHFKVYPQSTLYSTDMVGLGTVNKSLYFRILASDLSSGDVTGWSNWVSTHNPSVYYALATPTDTQITDADLIADLEALASAQLATGQNTITSSTPMPNLDAILTIEAFNNNWNGLSQALLGA